MYPFWLKQVSCCPKPKNASSAADPQRNFSLLTPEAPSPPTLIVKRRCDEDSALKVRV